MVGIASGAYSSIFIASPVLTHWKEREPVYRQPPRAHRARTRRRARLRDRRARARPSTSSPTQAQAPRARQPDRARASRASRSPRDEFQELVARPRRRAPSRADRRAPTGARPRGRRAAPAAKRRRRADEPAAERRGARRATRGRPDARGPRAQGQPQAARQAASARATAGTGGRADGHARLGDDGPRRLALHDLPARPLLGRDRRRVPRLARRRDRHRPDHLRRHGPRRVATTHDMADRARGDPGRDDRHGGRVPRWASAASAQAHATSRA